MPFQFVYIQPLDPYEVPTTQPYEVPTTILRLHSACNESNYRRNYENTHKMAFQYDFGLRQILYLALLLFRVEVITLKTFYER